MSPVRGREGRAPFALERIERETFVRRIDYHRTIGSTNVRAMELAQDARLTTPLLVLAERQTAGKGRGANVWWSAPGALTFSLVLDLDDTGRGPESWPRYALAAAVGVCEALEAAAPGHAFGIRWPNDVCHERRKICGILPELSLAAWPRLVLGVGINVNNSASAAPPELRETAMSLFDLTGCKTDLTALLVAVVRQLETRFGALTAGDAAIAQSWSQRCLLRGKRVRVASGGDETEGPCAGIAPDGALLLGSGAGQLRFYGGTLCAISAM